MMTKKVNLLKESLREAILPGRSYVVVGDDTGTISTTLLDVMNDHIVTSNESSPIVLYVSIERTELELSHLYMERYPETIKSVRVIHLPETNMMVLTNIVEYLNDGHDRITMVVVDKWNNDIINSMMVPHFVKKHNVVLLTRIKSNNLVPLYNNIKYFDTIIVSDSNGATLVKNRPDIHSRPNI